MALHADTVWEMRTTGSNTNGGLFYDRDPGTSVDYSQQAAAQLALSDLAMVTAGTTLTSATGGFTAAMAGNGIYIASGTNFTAGWYEITAHTDTNTVTLDRDATTGSNGSSGVGNVGGAAALPNDVLLESLADGNRLWIAFGTYTQVAAVNLSNIGSQALQIKIAGYNSSRGDNPTGASRPTIAAGANETLYRTYILIEHLHFTTTHASGIRCDNVTTRDCSVVNSSGTGGRKGFFDFATNTRFFNSEATSTNGSAFAVRSGRYYRCYGHDSTTAFNLEATGAVVENCTADTCTTGFSASAKNGTVLRGNTIYNCTTGINGTTSYAFIIMDNIIDNCTTGISWTSEFTSNCYDYNNYSNNGADVVNVTKGNNSTATDPAFGDAGAGDFTPATGNGVYVQGSPRTLGVVSLVTGHQGAVPPVAGGGGVSTGPIDQQFVR